MPDDVKKLAIVGASVRAAAFSALHAGYEVVAADLFADADLERECQVARVRNYPDSLAEWLVETDCDGWIYTGALENHADLISRMSKLRTLLGNSSGALRAVRNPLVLQTVLQAEGIAFPETVDSAARLPLDGSWLCKTYRGASGSGVWLLFGADARARAETERAFFQRFVSGVSAAAIFVCFDGGAQLLGVTRQLVGDARAGAKPWHYAGSIGPLPLNKEIQTQLNKLGELLSARFQLRGLVGVDLVLADNRAWVLEVNPRYTSSAEIVERVCGESLFGLHVAACRGESVSASASIKGDGPAHGKIVIYAKRDVTISEEFFAWAIDQSAVDAKHCQLADVPAADQMISSGQPVLTVFASGPIAEVEAELGTRVREVEQRLYSQAN